MKIVYLLSNPGLGGIERRLSWIVPSLNRGGHAASILNLRSSGKAHELWQAEGVPLRTIPNEGINGLLAPYRLLRQLRRDRPDVVHIFGLRANLVSRIAARLAGVPTVISGQVSTDDWRKWYHVLADRLTSPLVSRYMANSDAVRRAFLEREKVHPDRIFTVHNGIDPERYQPDATRRTELRRQWGVDPDETLFMMIANVRPAKNHAGLLDAVSELARDQSGFKVVLIGEDYSGGQLAGEIKRRGLCEFVRYLGHHPDAGQLWSAADVAMLSSLWEGFPFSLMEAMASGVPVISTRVGGVAELVDEGTSGLIVPPQDSHALRDAMRCLLQSPERRQQMGEAAKRRVHDRFSLRAMLDRMLTLYGSETTLEAAATRSDAAPYLTTRETSV